MKVEEKIDNAVDKLDKEWQDKEVIEEREIVQQWLKLKPEIPVPLQAQAFYKFRQKIRKEIYG